MKPKWEVSTCYGTKHTFDNKIQMLEFIRKSVDFPMRVDKVDEPTTYEQTVKNLKTKGDNKNNYE